MSDDDDERQAQRKFDPPVVSSTGPSRPIEVAASDQDASPVEVSDPDKRDAQVKAVAPPLAPPASVGPSGLAAPAAPAPDGAPDAGPDAVSAPDRAPDAAPDAVSADAPDPDERPTQVKVVTPFVVPLVHAAPTVPVFSPVPAGGSAALPVPVFPPPPARVPAEAALEDDADYDDAAEDSADDEPEIPLTFADRLRRLSPPLVILSILSIGSLVFLALAMTSHTTPVPVLLSSAVVVGLAFTVDTVVASFMTWRAGQNGDGGRALLLALIGGTSAVIAAGAYAGTLILVLLLKS